MEYHSTITQARLSTVFFVFMGIFSKTHYRLLFFKFPFNEADIYENVAASKRGSHIMLFLQIYKHLYQILCQGLGGAAGEEWVWVPLTVILSPGTPVDSVSRLRSAETVSSSVLHISTV